MPALAPWRKVESIAGRSCLMMFYGHNTTPWNRAFHIRLPFWPHPDCIKGNGLEAGRELVRVRDGFSKLRSMVARDEGWRTQAYLAQPKPDWRQTLSWADHEPSWAQLGPNLGQTWAQHGETCAWAKVCLAWRNCWRNLSPCRGSCSPSGTSRKQCVFIMPL